MIIDALSARASPGIQRFIIRQSGWYMIEAYGAMGRHAQGNNQAYAKQTFLFLSTSSYLTIGPLSRSSNVRPSTRTYIFVQKCIASDISSLSHLLSSLITPTTCIIFSFADTIQAVSFRSVLSFICLKITVSLSLILDIIDFTGTVRATARRRGRRSISPLEPCSTLPSASRSVVHVHI